MTFVREQPSRPLKVPAARKQAAETRFFLVSEFGQCGVALVMECSNGYNVNDDE